MKNRGDINVEENLSDASGEFQKDLLNSQYTHEDIRNTNTKLFS